MTDAALEDIDRQYPRTAKPGDVPLDFVPFNTAGMRWALSDPLWRLCSGQLYWIMIKGEDGQVETKVRFIPNRAQRRFIKRLWYRNIILKARQLGFTTLVAIMFLDHALFNANQRVAIIAQDKPTAEVLFRDKVRFAYDNLPEALRLAMPTGKDAADELLFTHNNSSFRVSTSTRSGTVHRLLVSEFGKICASSPAKADEVITGSIQSVPNDGIVIIESTAEGQEGAFYTMCQAAEALAQAGKPLNNKQYRFNFAPWHEAPEYEMDPAGVIISQTLIEYFTEVEATMRVTLSPRKRAWYASKLANDFATKPEAMWSEYPSTPKEAFQRSLEGVYYAKQLAEARIQGRITTVPYIAGIPVNTCWDIGASDGTAVWAWQDIGLKRHFIWYMEGWGEPYSHFVREMQSKGWIWGVHLLPHDATQQKQLADAVVTPIEMLEELCRGWKFEIVPRVDELINGIQATRDVFSELWFDEQGCAEGLKHLGLYRKEWNARVGGWKDTPRKDEHTEAADALRQFAQWRRAYSLSRTKPLNRRHRSAMAA